MRILSSDVSMQSRHTSTLSIKQRTNINLWRNEPTTSPPITELRKPHPGQTTTLNNTNQSNQVSKQPETTETEDAELSPELLKMKQAIESLMAWISGRVIKLSLFSSKSLQSKDPSENIAQPNTSDKAPANAQTNPKNNWGATVSQVQEMTETESLNLGISGKVSTADGNQIRFNLAMALSRQYYSSEAVTTRFGSALKDPLVINYQGKPAQLSLDHIAFDLSQSGTAQEKLPILQSGSGYLALDKNGNGIIDDGRELFGPQSGNGFLDLANYDEDGNQWIDEGDSIFSKLVVWQPAPDGSQQMIAIGKLGIGALHTQSINAKFDYKDSQNNLQASMQQAGLFLYENGEAGTMQQIDIAA